jgi:hypothetical protein
MDYLGTLISARCFTNCYMQFVASYVLVGINGFAFLADCIGRFKKYKTVWFITVFILFLLMDYSILRQSIKLFRIPYKRVETVPIIVQYIKQHSTESDFIWDITSDLAYYYLAAQRCSPTRYLNVHDSLYPLSIISLALKLICMLVKIIKK